MGQSLVGSGVLVAVATGLAGNIGTSLIPQEWLRGRELLVGVVIAVLVLAGVVLEVLRFRREQPVGEEPSGESGASVLRQEVQASGRNSTATSTTRDVIHSGGGPVYTGPVTQVAAPAPTGRAGPGRAHRREAAEYEPDDLVSTPPLLPPDAPAGGAPGDGVTGSGRRDRPA